MAKTKIIVTGATGSIGYEAVKGLLEKKTPVLMACRDMHKGEETMRKVMTQYPDADIQLLPLDLASIKSILDFVQRLHDERIQPMGLLNNAALMSRRYALTEDDFESTMGVNYLGTYLLTRKILPMMTADAIIVNTVSVTCHLTRLDRQILDAREEKFGQLKTYAKSKLAVMLFSVALAERASVRVNVTDPGVVNSNMIAMDRWFDPLANIFFRPLCKSPERGAIPAIRALQSNESGQCFYGDKQRPIKKKFLEHPYVDWLWENTEILFHEKGVHF